MTAIGMPRATRPIRVAIVRFRVRHTADRVQVRMTIAIIVVVVLIVVFLVGRLLWVPSRNKKCSRCGQRTPLESEVCEHCGHVFHVR
jgi:hypothetical protein